MGYHTHTLPCGLRLIHHPSPSPVVYCGYGICAGTRHEMPGEEGLAHFCEHVTFKGTMRRSALQVLNGLERYGGDLNAFTAKEHTMYYAAILKDHFAVAVDLLTDIVFHSTYPQQELDKEIEVVCDEIASYNDSPAELIYDEFENVLFGGHPLGHNILGHAERLRCYTTADVSRFTQRHYRPSNAVFFVSGDVDFSRVVRLVEKATSHFPLSTPCMSHESVAHSPLPAYKPFSQAVSKHTHQAHVMLGSRAFPAHDEHRMPLYLLNNMLGGPAMNARLNIALRERRGLVYTVESSMVSYSDTGVWCLYYGCDHSDTSRCRRLVARELDKVMQKPLSTKQLDAAKRQLKGQIAVACDNRESFALDVAKSYLHHGKEKDVETLFRRIDGITPADVQQVAQQVLGDVSMLMYE